MKMIAAFLCAACNVFAQTNDLTGAQVAAALVESNPPASAGQRAEQIRAQCLAGRRIICGKILKVLPAGLVVESGYPDLLHPPLNRSWLVPGSVSVTRAVNLMEASEPEAVGVGVVFLTDLPKSRGAATKPKPYDYVILLGYPAGEYTYESVGTVKKTVRRFSANLLKAVNLNLELLKKPEPSHPPK